MTDVSPSGCALFGVTFILFLLTGDAAGLVANMTVSTSAFSPTPTIHVLHEAEFTQKGSAASSAVPSFRAAQVITEQAKSQSVGAMNKW